jgi:hypothetical protein
MKLSVLLLAAPLALLACLAPQRPFHFVSPRVSADVVDSVARTLAANGHQPANIDRAVGIVTTKWEDTGFKYGFVQGKEATLVRRYTVTIAPGAAADDVTVRQDSKRCQTGGYTLGDLDVRGPCEVEDALIPQHQQELDALGQTLQGALAQAR